MNLKGVIKKVIITAAVTISVIYCYTTFVRNHSSSSQQPLPQKVSDPPKWQRKQSHKFTTKENEENEGIKTEPSQGLSAKPHESENRSPPVFTKRKQDTCVVDELAIPSYEKREKQKLSHLTESAEGLCTGKKCPNIIYLLVDDMGYGDVGYNGGEAYTPHLNSMAAGPHSVHFTRYYSGGATCSPTRGTLLTGRNHNRYCIWHADLGEYVNDHTCPSLGPLPTSEVTVSQILKNAGYHTSIYGKWHLGDLKPIKGGNVRWKVSHPGMHGFTDWWVTERPISTLLPNCPCSNKCPCSLGGSHYKDIKWCRNYWGMDSETGDLVKYPMQVLDDSDFIVDQLKNLLDNRNKSVPFFTILSFHAVHSPFYASPRWKEYYKKETHIRKKHYLGTVSGVDESIGRVRQLLKEYDIYNDTMLWFSSDNGPQDGEPSSAGKLRGWKGSVWEGGIRVPGIIEWPAVIRQNRVMSTPVVTNDFLPTITDLLGLDPPNNVKLDGISILPLLQNKTTKRGENIFFAFHIKKGNLNSDYSATMVGDRYKYHASFDGGKMTEFYLFDLEKEASEKTNVSMLQPELTMSMKTELDNFLTSVTKSANEIGCISTHDRRSVKC